MTPSSTWQPDFWASLEHKLRYKKDIPATSEMGFGGVGESGMGSYHGKDGFHTFSHYKSIVDKKTWLDLPMRYQPYRKIYEKLLRKFLK